MAPVKKAVPISETAFLFDFAFCEDISEGLGDDDWSL